MGKNIQNVSKEIFLNALTCPTLGWLMRYRHYQITPTIGDMFRKEQGKEIGKRAQDLYPDGFLVNNPDIFSASEKTLDLLNGSGISTIFEGAFLTGGFSARADILRRKGKSWNLIEVKSGIKDRDDFIDDMAYTAMVIQLSGIDISKVSLFLISRNFRLGMENKDLFVEIDHTNEVLDRVNEFKLVCDDIEGLTRKSKKPAPRLRFECRKCKIFKKCVGMEIENHIFDISRLSKEKFNELIEYGIVCIEDIPEGFFLSENQDKVRICVQEKRPIVSDNLKSVFDSIIWPAYYLDFEAVTTAIPLYKNVLPYNQLPTQYSIHKCSGPGEILNHFEYLSDPKKDCRKELAIKLIKDLEGKGSIIVYSNFEKRIIKSLSRLCPGISEELNLLVDRLVDLEAIIRKNFYHPDFHGSTSIKKTLPVLVPGMSYNGLEISEGDSAMAVFANLALNKFDEEKAKKIKKDLLDYCKQDTLAMVKLHESLINYL